MEKFPKHCELKYNSKGYSTGISDPNTRLKLQQFYVAFLVLFFGCLIAFVQFMREKMHYHFEIEKKKKRKEIALAAVAELERERQEVLIAISYALFL